MRTVLGFDELNTALPIEQYFGEMDLTRSQKEERISLARDIEAVMLYFFDAVALYLNEGVGNNTTLLTLLIEELEEIFDSHDVDDEKDDSIVPDVLAALLYRVHDDFEISYPLQLAVTILESTFRNIDKPETLSANRARKIAEEESNTIHNHRDFVKAVRKGKTRKRWVTKHDPKVRPTHKPVDGKTIPIGDYFEVGNARMLYPRDVINAGAYPEEIINCRCAVIYS